MTDEFNGLPDYPELPDHEVPDQPHHGPEEHGDLSLQIIEQERLIRDQQTRLEEMRIQNAGLRRDGIPVQVTICIPVMNDFITLGMAIASVSPAKNQTIPLNIILADNGSDDPCGDILLENNDGIKRYCKGLGFTNTLVLSKTPFSTHDLATQKQLVGQERKNVNVAFMRKKLSVFVNTPFMMYLDADVECPYDGVRLLLEDMQQDPKIAWWGAQYSRVVDHVQAGCTMARTPIMKKINWKAHGCTCRWINEHFRSQGLIAGHREGLYAVHHTRWKHRDSGQKNG